VTFRRRPGGCLDWLRTLGGPPRSNVAAPGERPQVGDADPAMLFGGGPDAADAAWHRCAPSPGAGSAIASSHERTGQLAGAHGKGPGAPGSARGLPRYPRRAWLEPESCRADIPTLGSFEQFRVAGRCCARIWVGLIRFLSTSSTAGQRRLRGARARRDVHRQSASPGERGLKCVSYFDGWGN
jgi:hypothetical protein